METREKQVKEYFQFGYLAAANHAGRNPVHPQRSGKYEARRKIRLLRRYPRLSRAPQNKAPMTLTLGVPQVVPTELETVQEEEIQDGGGRTSRIGGEWTPTLHQRRGALQTESYFVKDFNAECDHDWHPREIQQRRWRDLSRESLRRSKSNPSTDWAPRLRKRLGNRVTLTPVGGPDEIYKPTSIGSAVSSQCDEKVQLVTGVKDTVRNPSKTTGIEGVLEEEGHHLNDPFGTGDDPPPAGAVLYDMGTYVRQWWSELRPKFLWHLPLRPPLGNDHPMGMHNLAAEEVGLGLIPFKKHPELRAGAVLDVHGTTPKVGSVFLRVRYAYSVGQEPQW